MVVVIDRKRPESMGEPVLTILGSRGSIPVSGDAFTRYGGNTTSLALSTNGEISMFVDAGTGLNAYGAHGLVLRPTVKVFLTHYHWDHIQGLSMLGQLWDGNCVLEIFGPGSPQDLLTQAIGPPWFPVSLSDQANVTFQGVDMPVTDESVLVTSFPIHHPQGGVGYRLDGPNTSAAIVTDHETTPESTSAVLGAIQGVDTLIYDAQYTPHEMAQHAGWGHSSWKDAVRIAADVGATRLILTSHDPAHSDDALDAILASARQSFPNTDAAIPGLTIDL